ncbi:MAG: efflux transporter outer membrane subunit [Pseudomonadota bacterium]
MRGRRVFPAALAVLLAGCTIGPDYVRPDMPLPAKWRNAGKGAPASTEQSAQWWKNFNDPVLEKLVAQALESSLDLKLARARIREARAQLVVAEAAGAPNVTASASAARGMNSANVVQSSSAGTVFSTGGVVYDLYKAGFDAQWELDLFGGVRRSVEAAQATAEAAEEDGRAVQISLLGEVARNYIELRAAQRQIAIARENARAQQETAGLVRSRYRAGLSSDLDVARAEAQAAATAAQIPPLEAALDKAVHRLGVLLGKAPGALAEDLAREAPVPISSAQVAAGLPSELLQRRPDIRRAERQLAAATALTGAATADLFPRFNLAAMIGLQSSDASTFTDGGSKAWSLVPGLSLPVFNAGRIRANIEAKDAQQEQALAKYQAAVLSALEEVENSLAVYVREQLRRESLLQAEEANRRAVALASERYVKGLASFLDVLDAERSLYAAQSLLSQSEASLSSDLVALYKALGGEWETSVGTP